MADGEYPVQVIHALAFVNCQDGVERPVMHGNVALVSAKERDRLLELGAVIELDTDAEDRPIVQEPSQVFPPAFERGDPDTTPQASTPPAEGEGAAGSEPVAEDGLDDMTIADLQKLAEDDGINLSERGIKSDSKKAEIIDAMRAAYAEEPPEGEK